MRIDDTFNQAVEHHQAGRLAQAEEQYEQILAVQPDHSDCLHLLGVIAHQRGRHEDGVRLIQRAIAIKSGDPAYHSNLGVTFRALNRFEEAVAAFRRATQIDPHYTAGQSGLSVVLNQLGRGAEAIEHLQRAVQQNPKDAALGKRLGALLLDRARPEEAARVLRVAAELKPDDPELRNNLGVALKDSGRLEDACRELRAALELRPAFPEAYNNLGTALSMQRRNEESLVCFEKAIELKPEYVEARHNRGVALRDMGRLDEAAVCLREVVDEVPGDADAQNNLGATVQALGHYDQAREHYERALRIHPDHVWAHFNRSTVLLSDCDFEHGWLEYEWRLKRPGFKPRRFAKPLWDGLPRPDKSILLHTEQGLGDTIQLIRYAALVKERMGKVIVECQDLLVPLLSRCRAVDCLIARGSPLPPFDYYAPIMSLPCILGTRLDTIPSEVPYIFPAPDLVENWRKRLAGVDGFKVGVNWQGNPRFQRDYQRSIPLKHFAPLAEVPGVRLISLQWGEGRDQLDAAAFPITDFGDDLDKTAGAFMDRAAIMMSLDLVVSSDTATAHLAGGLGVPTWVGLAFSPDWRWLRTGESCPWYPTMHLFRQAGLGDWDGVFERMAGRLREAASACSASDE